MPIECSLHNFWLISNMTLVVPEGSESTTGGNCRTSSRGPWRRQILRLLTVGMVATACSSGLLTTSSQPSTTSAGQPAEHLESVDFQVPFRLPAVEGWVLQETLDFEAEINSGGNYVVLTTAGPSDVDGWVDHLTTDTEVLASEAPSFEVGGLPASVIDAALADSAAPKPECDSDPCFVLFSVDFHQQSNTTYALVADHPTRIWLLDVRGETVAIIAEAPMASFDGWVVEVEAALTELEWTAP